MRWVLSMYVVSIDKRGRILLPSEVRKRIGVKERSKLALRVRDDGVVELISLDKLRDEVAKVFEEKFKGWREEDHEASKLLSEIVS